MPSTRRTTAPSRSCPDSSGFGGRLALLSAAVIISFHLVRFAALPNFERLC
jgi:hypothetical protein